MPTNVLSDARVWAVKASERAQKLFDGGGLHLFVSPTDTKVWRIAYRLAGSPKTMSVGPYPDVSLAAARGKRDELKAVLRDGGDPMAPRKESRGTLTLQKACEDFWSGRDDVSADYRTNALRGLELHLWPSLGDRMIASITRADLLVELERMDASGLRVYVRKVRQVAMPRWWGRHVKSWGVMWGVQ